MLKRTLLMLGVLVVLLSALAQAQQNRRIGTVTVTTDPTAVGQCLQTFGSTSVGAWLACGSGGGSLITSGAGDFGAATSQTGGILTGTVTSGAHLGAATVPTSSLATVQGNGTKVQLSTGATTTNDCVKYDANGNTVDNGTGCGGIGGLTNNRFPKANSSTTLANSSLSDDGTTVSTAEPVSAGGLTSTGPTSITGNRTTGADQISNANINGSLNCKTFGAVGDFATDDTAALQACITAAEVNNPGGKTVRTAPAYIPHGDYSTTFPLILTGGDAGFATSLPYLYGDTGVGSKVPGTAIFPSGHFPALFVAGGTDYMSSLGTIAGSALTGSGNSLVFNSGKPYFLNMSEMTSAANSAGDVAPLNGLSNLTVQFYFTTPAAGATSETLLMSNPSASGSVIGAIYLNFTVGGGIASSLSIGGVQKLVNPAGTVNANTTYWVALVLDHTNSKECIFLAAPGSTNNSAIGSVATGGGSITQVVKEGFVFGGFPNQWPTQGISSPFIGSVQSLDLETTAVYSCNSSTVTAPSANFTFGANTLYGNNFTSISPTKNGVANTPVISVDYLNGAAQTQAWQTIRNPTYNGNSSGVYIDGLAFVGGTESILWAQAPNSTIRDILSTSSTYAGIEAFNNTYNSLLDNISFLPGSFAAAGLMCGWGIGEGDHIQATGGYYQIVAGDLGCGVLNYPITAGSSTSIANIYGQWDASGFVTDTYTGLQSDNENGGNVSGIELDAGGGYLNLFGGNLLPTGTGSPILINGNAPGFNLSLTGTRFEPVNTTPFVINYLGACGTPVNLNGVSTDLQSIALTNCPANINQAGCGGKVTLSSGAGTLTNFCVTTASICSAVDTTTFTNAVTLAAPANGSIALSGGTGSDVIKVDCR